VSGQFLQKSKGKGGVFNREERHGGEKGLQIREKCGGGGGGFFNVSTEVTGGTKKTFNRKHSPTQIQSQENGRVGTTGSEKGRQRMCSGEKGRKGLSTSPKEEKEVAEPCRCQSKKKTATKKGSLAQEETKCAWMLAETGRTIYPSR